MEEQSAPGEEVEMKRNLGDCGDMAQPAATASTAAAAAAATPTVSGNSSAGSSGVSGQTQQQFQPVQQQIENYALMTGTMMLVESRPLQPFKTSEEYLYAMKEDLAEWLNTMYKLGADVDSFMGKLETGVVLCEHANNVRVAAKEYRERHPNKKKLFAKYEVPDYHVAFRPDVKPGTFFARDNVHNFIAWCRRLGIMDCLLFETDDLVLRKNEKSVVLCLLEVARRGARYGMAAPLLVQFEKEIDRDIARDIQKEIKRQASNMLMMIESGTPSGTLTAPSGALTTTTGASTSAAAGGDGATLTPPMADSGVHVNGSSAAPSSASLTAVPTSNGTGMMMDDDDDDDSSIADSCGSCPQIVTNDLKSLDEMVRELVERCLCPVQFPMIRVAEGKYRIGDTKVMIYVRILRSHVMVRVGGGWDTLEHYLDKHDPCRCRLGHRGTLSSKVFMKQSAKDGSINPSVVQYERSDSPGFVKKTPAQIVGQHANRPFPASAVPPSMSSAFLSGARHSVPNVGLAGTGGGGGGSTSSSNNHVNHVGANGDGHGHGHVHPHPAVAGVRNHPHPFTSAGSSSSLLSMPATLRRPVSPGRQSRIDALASTAEHRSGSPSRNGSGAKPSPRSGSASRDGSPFGRRDAAAAAAAAKANSGSRPTLVNDHIHATPLKQRTIPANSAGRPGAAAAAGGKVLSASADVVNADDNDENRQPHLSALAAAGDTAAPLLDAAALIAQVEDASRRAAAMELERPDSRMTQGSSSECSSVFSSSAAEDSCCVPDPLAESHASNVNQQLRNHQRSLLLHDKPRSISVSSTGSSQSGRYKKSRIPVLQHHQDSAQKPGTRSVTTGSTTAIPQCKSGVPSSPTPTPKLSLPSAKDISNGTASATSTLMRTNKKAYPARNRRSSIDNSAFETTYGVAASPRSEHPFGNLSNTLPNRSKAAAERKGRQTPTPISSRPGPNDANSNNRHRSSSVSSARDEGYGGGRFATSRENSRQNILAGSGSRNGFGGRSAAMASPMTSRRKLATASASKPTSSAVAAMSKMADRQWDDILEPASPAVVGGPTTTTTTATEGGDLQEFLREIQTDDDEAIMVKMKAILAQYEARVAHTMLEEGDDDDDGVPEGGEAEVLAKDLAHALKTNGAVNGGSPPLENERLAPSTLHDETAGNGGETTPSPLPDEDILDHADHDGEQHQLGSGSYTEQWLLENHHHLLGDTGRRKSSVGKIPVQTLLYETPGEAFP